MEDKYKKITENINKIMHIEGFLITAHGDPSVGIFPSSWKLEGDFYFDNQEECDEFKKEIKISFESYCGEIVEVITYEEYESMIDLENEV